MWISILWLSRVQDHQLPNKVTYLSPLMHQPSQNLSGRIESEHLPLLKILTCFFMFWTHSKDFKSSCSQRLKLLCGQSMADKPMVVQEHFVLSCNNFHQYPHCWNFELTVGIIRNLAFAKPAKHWSGFATKQWQMRSWFMNIFLSGNKFYQYPHCSSFKLTVSILRNLAFAKPVKLWIGFVVEIQQIRPWFNYIF